MITLNCILYDGNYEQVVSKDSWFFTFKSDYITKKRLTINNLENIDNFYKLLKNTNKHEEIEIIFVDDYYQEANIFFNLNMTKDTLGYNYCLPYFVDILTTKTPYILNVSSDCYNQISIGDNFFKDSIDVLKNNDEYCVTTISWEESWLKIGIPTGIPSNISCIGEWEQINNTKFNKENEFEKFYCSEFFSDQIFIGNIEKLKKLNYNLKNITKQNEPWYGGGNSFELRLSNSLAEKNTFRLIYKDTEMYYKHNNFVN